MPLCRCRCNATGGGLDEGEEGEGGVDVRLGDLVSNPGGLERICNRIEQNWKVCTNAHRKG